MTDIETNYFSTIEDHFRVARGTGMYIFSPRDVALIEAWKQGGIPIEAVLRGIDAVFEKRRERPGLSRTQSVNSIAHCTQAIAVEAQAMANVTPITRQPTQAPPFSLDEVRASCNSKCRRAERCRSQRPGAFTRCHRSHRALLRSRKTGTGNHRDRG
jgi:hypothetical protein